MSKRMEQLERELRSMEGLEMYRLNHDERIEYAKREKNARMRAEGSI